MISPPSPLPLLPFSGHQVYQTLRRGGRVSGLDAAMRPIVPAGLTFGYRNKVSFTFSARCWEPTLGGDDGAEDERGRVVNRWGMRGARWLGTCAASTFARREISQQFSPPTTSTRHTHTHA